MSFGNSIVNVRGSHFNLFWIGIDGFDAIQTIDPMKLNRIKIFQGDGPVSINSSLSKAVVTGFANTEVVQSKYDWMRPAVFIRQN